MNAVIDNTIAQQFERAVKLHKQGKFERAKILYQKVLKCDSKHPYALGYLGVVEYQLENYKDALPYLDNALIEIPDEVNFHLYKGLVLQELYRCQEALPYFEKVLQQKKSIIALNHYGMCLTILGRYNEAFHCYQTALNQQINDKSYLCLAALYYKLLRYNDARVCFEKSISLVDNNVESYRKYSDLLSQLGEHEKALDNYEKILKLDPNNNEAIIKRFSVLNSLCDWRMYDKTLLQIDKILRTELLNHNNLSANQFSILSFPYNTKKQAKFAKHHAHLMAKKMRTIAPDLKFKFNRQPTERIKIGYMSANFRDHATGHKIINMFQLHNRDRYEIFTYSYGPDDKSYYRKQIEQDSEHFNDCINIGDIDFAKQIYKDGVHILMDLKGYTENSRVQICAYRPAPVMVTYLGFPGTSGADFFDYVLTDEIVTPKEEQKLYTEKFIHMPDSYQINDYQQTIAIPPTRVSCGLPDDAFVFCNMNTSYKIRPVVFDIWMNILKAVPNSVLWILGSNKTMIQNLKHEASKRNVSPERIIFAEKKKKAQHLARLTLVDLFIDTFSYGAHTTAADSLWANVPILTWLGDTFARRVAASCLQAMGLPELIAKSHEEYQKQAIYWATHPEEFAKLKTKLKTNMTTYPLFDTSRFVKNLETAYEKIWQRYLEGQPPEHIYL